MENQDTILYHFHPESGEFIGTSIARLDPREQKPIVPAFATTTAPPSVAENEVAVFETVDWSVYPDFRGQTFYRKADRAAVEVKEIGAGAILDLTDQAPTTEFDVWEDGQWVTDTTAQNNAAVMTAITALEAEVTQRRIREAVLGTDNGWLADLEAEIAVLRGQML